MNSVLRLLVVSIGIAFLHAAALAAGENVTGKWSPVTNLPLVPSSGAVLPDGKVVLWAADGEFSFGSGTSAHSVTIDPATGDQQSKTTTTGHNMFCTGTTNLADGKILINGGNYGKVTTLYDPASDSFVRSDNMSVARGYNSNTILNDGSVLTIGGSWNDNNPARDKTAELWTQSGGWRTLTGIPAAPLSYFDSYLNRVNDYHYWLIPSGNGKVLFAGPSPDMRWIKTGGSGSLAPAGPRGDDEFAVSGNTTMFAAGKILKNGGAPRHSRAVASNKSYIIDTTSASAVAAPTGNMIYQRGYANSVVLPDGKVIVIGGQSYAVIFSDSDAVLATEIWNPATGQYSLAAPISVPRNYHSIAMLLPDGRVLSGGGGLCACSADHPDYQIFTPPNLLDENGDPLSRPTITSAPSTIAYGGTAMVTTDQAVTSFALVRLSSTTHTVNNDQRRLDVDFTQTGVNQYALSISSNSNYLLPGYWMLFALDSNGTYSVSKIVHVAPNAIAHIVTDPVSVPLGAAISFQPEITKVAADVTFGGTGLPPDVTVDATTGLVSGTPAAAGIFHGALTATDGIRTVSADLVITVSDRAPTITTPAAQNGVVGIAAALALSASDPDDGTLTYSATGLPPGLTVNAATGDISGTPTAAGSYTVTATATDTDELAAAASFFWNIAIPNRAPAITTPAAQTGVVGTARTLAIVASDPDGDTMRFAATGLPPGLTINATTGVISGTPIAAGTFTPAVTATDSDDLSASISFSWSIGDITPSVVALSVQPGFAGAVITYAPQIANRTSVTYRWNFGDGTADTSYQTVADASHVFQPPGIYSVTLTMRNSSGNLFTYRFDQAIHAQPLAALGASSSGLAFEPRAGTKGRLWAVNRDSDSVAVIDLSNNTMVAEIAVGVEPVGIARHPGGNIWVVNRRSSSISIVDPASLAVAREVQLPRASQPGGVVFAGAKADGYVTLEARSRVAIVTAAGNFAGSLVSGGRPRFIATNGPGNALYVSNFITPPLPGESTAIVSTIDSAGSPLGGQVNELAVGGRRLRNFVLAHSNRVDTEVSARGIPNYLGAAAQSPDGASLWVPSKQDNILRGARRDGNDLNFQNTVRAIVSRVDLTTGLEILADRIDVDNSGIVSAVVFHPTGAYLFAALQTSREVAVLDPAFKRELFRFKVGRAPSSLTISPDGTTLYVGNVMDRSITIVDLAPMLTAGRKQVNIVATVGTVATEKLSATLLAGKQFFYDAADTRLARDGYISCAVCHDNGMTDGRVWDFTGFGEGLRSTISLEGHGGMAQGFLHWSANFDEVQDFEGQIRDFAGGTGLMADDDFLAGTRYHPLGDTKAGISADLDALAAYVSSHTAAAASPFRKSDGTQTNAALLGKRVFKRSGCARCHAGNALTASSDASALRDVGTITPDSGNRLGDPLTGIDIPTLRGLWGTRPYLHNGSASTLRKAIRAHTKVKITRRDMKNLVRFLLQIEKKP